MLIDEPTYLTLLQRYKELASGGGGGMGGDVPFEIDTHIVEINTDAIDANYMNSRFEKFLKLIQKGDTEQHTIDSALLELHKSFAMLSREEQKYQSVHPDIRAGNIVIDPVKHSVTTFQLYEARRGRSNCPVVRRLGCYEEN
jgi:type I restriction enzyme R subunit